uniref:Uncharacterized protein n=1 Tax=Oryza sativa subsp. japonica TaxID=39947 RepID=Q5Z7K4_ORYSJ|nr:hypothetical protein [Oryza sativa Japonica Group]
MASRRRCPVLRRRGCVGQIPLVAGERRRDAVAGDFAGGGGRRLAKRREGGERRCGKRGKRRVCSPAGGSRMPAPLPVGRGSRDRGGGEEHRRPRRRPCHDARDRDGAPPPSRVEGKGNESVKRKGKRLTAGKA